MKKFLIMTKSGSLYMLERDWKGKTELIAIKSTAISESETKRVIGFSHEEVMNKLKKGQDDANILIEIDEIEKSKGKQALFNRGGHTSTIKKAWLIDEELF